MCPKKMGKRGESMKNVTLQDVAELAGVSQTTASLTLNHSSRANFRNGTRKRVLAAERQLGYRCVPFVKNLQFTDSVLLHISATLRWVRHDSAAQFAYALLRTAPANFI